MITKQFKIRQLTLRQEEYIVEEFIYLFGICVWNRYYALDGRGGQFPFKLYPEALKAKEVLESNGINNKTLIVSGILILISVLFLCRN